MYLKIKDNSQIMRKKKIIAKNNLKFFRTSISGMSQQKLAGLVNENWQNIQRYETMQRDLTMAMAQNIAPHLGLEDAAMLFSRSPDLKYPEGGTKVTGGLGDTGYTGRRQKLNEFLEVWDSATIQEKKEILAIVVLEKDNLTETPLPEIEEGEIGDIDTIIGDL